MSVNGEMHLYLCRGKIKSHRTCRFCQYVRHEFMFSGQTSDHTHICRTKVQLVTGLFQQNIHNHVPGNSFVSVIFAL